MKAEFIFVSFTDGSPVLFHKGQCIIKTESMRSCYLDIEISLVVNAVTTSDITFSCLGF